MKRMPYWMILFFFLVSLIYWSIPAPTVPSFPEVKNSTTKSDAVLLDRYGEAIHEMRIDKKGRRLDWVGLKEISPSLQKAILHSEDRRFYSHRGVDTKAIGSALLSYLTSPIPRGASTLTMQLASLLNEKLKSPKKRRSLGQKWLQIREARAMERQWSKSQILEAYLNLVTFRGELQGVSAASRGLFGKEPHGLDTAESLVLASLLRDPNAPVGKVGQRACLLSASMKLSTGCEEVSSQAGRSLSGPYLSRPAAALAPHVALQLLRPQETDKKVAAVTSTLDGKLQRFATEVLRRHLLSVRPQNVHDGALLVIENKTGDVLAYIGNSGDLSSARYVDGVHAKRQAGSTLKPFLYGLALERRLLTAASLIDDSPLDISVFTGVYRPRNYDSHFQGPVTVRTALASSLNVPAVKVLQLVGVESFVQRLRQLGFKDLNESGDFYGPSLALGSADVSLWELVRAYRALANGGVWSEPRLAPGQETKASHRRVFSRESAFIVSSILSDRESRSHTFGLENPLSTRFWSAVKTGTSKEMRDNWCVGYSSQYTVGVWIGNFSGEPMWNVSGITGAAPVWVEIMNWLHSGSASRPERPPAGVRAKRVDLSPFESDRKEWFIAGTEPEILRQGGGPTNSKIVYPVDGTVIALDPDIPEEQQGLFFESQPGAHQLRWVLNGEEMGYAESILLWSPRLGRHTLSLVNQQNRMVDSVSFEVRGGSVEPNEVR